MVKVMTLNDITKKLFKNNKHQYLLLSCSLIFAITVVTAFGILLFSPTVKNVFVDGGSSMDMAITCFTFLIIGAIIFCGYVFSLFIKYKSKEIGIFMSLGIARKNVKKILLKEMSYLLPMVIVIGLILGLPLSYFSWTLFTNLIVKTAETNYTVGWTGYLIGIVFSIIIAVMINFMLSKYLKKVDIMKILKSEDSIEEIKSGNMLLGILGVILIPLGIVIYGLASRSDSFLGNISMIFAILPLIGIYLVAVQVSNIGDFVKKFSIKKYNKNIMFFNMLKLKGKQYSQTIIVTTILTAVIIFALCFSIGNFAAGQKIVKEYPVDFLLKYREDLHIVSEKKIKELADKYNINISEYEEFEAIMLIGDGVTYDEELDEDVYKEFAYDMYCISEATYNNLTGENIDVKEGFYCTIVDDTPKEVDETSIKLTNISQLYEKQYEDQGILVNKGINISGTYLLVLDDSDYNREYSSLNDKYKDVYIRFNVDNWEESYDFAKELRTFIVNNSIDDVAVESGATPFTEEFTDEEPAFEKLTLDPESAELYRWWKYNPKFKVLDYNDTVVQYAVYVLLFVFIALLGFISVSMIFYVKSISSVWDDKKIYQNISFLGAKKKYIKACITKVIAVLFILPTVLGAISAYSLILLIIGELKGQVLYKLVCENSLIIVIIFAFIQLIAFLITRKIVIKKILDFDTI